MTCHATTEQPSQMRSHLASCDGGTSVPTRSSYCRHISLRKAILLRRDICEQRPIMYQPPTASNREAFARSLRATLSELVRDETIEIHKTERLRFPTSAPATTLLGEGRDLPVPMWTLPRIASMGLPTQELLMYKAAQDRMRSENASLLVDRALASHQLSALTNQDFTMQVYCNHLKAIQKQAQCTSFPIQRTFPHFSHLMAEAHSRSAYPLPASVSVTKGLSSLTEEPSKPSRATRNKMIDIMKTLGSNPRKRSDPIVDCVDFVDNSDGKLSPTKLMFPERLHQLLREAEKDGLSDVVSFHPHGRSFAVHDMKRFVDEVLPKWFKQSKWNSFARQLNLYGFTRIMAGPDAGGYYHALFLRSRPSLSRYMMRVGVPTGMEDRRKQRPKNVLDTQDPDFYAMKSAYQ